MSCSQENEKKFTQFVNPSFQKYNRPILLSLTVFAIVHILVIIIAVVMTHICPHSIILADKREYYEHFDDLGVKCINWSAQLKNDLVVYCDLNPTYLGSPDPTKYCEDNGPIGKLCDEGNILVMIGSNICPDLGATIGSAFGYATPMTTGFSAIILLLFVKLGFVREFTEQECKEKQIDLVVKI